jgi:hypothetical protein
VSGLSHLAGRVLEQLSLASWLPAAMLVGNLAVLIQLHAQDSTQVGDALTTLTKSALGAVITLAFALVLAAIVTQAFEFELIRLLEGYVASVRGPVPRLVGRRIRRHTRKRQDLDKALLEGSHAAFLRAKTAMMRLPGYSQALLDAIERDVVGTSHPPGTRQVLIAEAAGTDWIQHVSSDTLYALDALDARLAAYPAAHRVLPTRLGNVMRSAEDRVTLSQDENLEGYVLRHHASLPENLRNEHHDYRTRLDMYTGLTLIFFVLAGSAGGLLAFAHWWVPSTVATAYMFFGWISYEATIASARGYGDVLQEIDAFVAGLRDAGP